MDLIFKKEIIDQIDLSSLEKYVAWSKNDVQYLNMPAGKEHYKLLAYLSTVLNCKNITEIKTGYTLGTTALSYSGNKTVNSYDIYSWLPDNETTIEQKSNVKLYVTDYMDHIDNMIIDCDLIVIDIDHSGTTEKSILDALRAKNYQGLVFLDDTNLNPEMKKFVENIPEKTIDITPYGHWSGNHLIVFNPNKFNVILE
jgi:hypothetical protein